MSDFTICCGSCVYSTVVSDGPVVECRRFPPAAVVLNDEPVMLWAQVTDSDLCGEYRRTRKHRAVVA